MISLFLAIAMFACLIPPVDMTAQAATSGYEIVTYARQYIGYPYKLGTTGPKSFDCAGFVHYVFKHFGVDLPTNASAYFYNPTKYGTLVGKGSIENAQMGDVIAWEGHVAIYTEGGYCVEALGTKYGVCETVRVNRHSNGMNYKVIRIKGVVSVGTPKISSLQSTNSGVEIKWNKVTNAEKYRILRKTSDGKWKKLTDTTSASYVDTTAKVGTKYSYTVVCINKKTENYASEYDTKGKSITRYANPKLSSVTDTAAGIKIKWDKSSGAAKYRVFYKTDSGGWKKIADTTSSSYVWTGAKSGSKYTFTVRCVSSDGKTYTSGYNSKGLSLTYIAPPKLKSVSVENSGTVIQWDKVKGAEKYRVFYKTGSGDWTKIADTTGTSYTWTKAEYGKEYTFTVRCLSKNGKTYVSRYDTKGKSLKIVKTPELSAISNVASGVKISWEKVSGAKKYRVFYRETGASGWTKIDDTTSTSFTWKAADSGKDYTFTVRCISNDEKTYASGYDTVGLKLTHIAAPIMTSVTADAEKTAIKWNEVNGAENYRVFSKTGESGWTKVADTDKTSYKVEGVALGDDYTFTVRCISSDGKNVSGYNSTGLKALAEPKISSLSKTEKGISVSWSKVSGAEKYRVFAKTETGNWKNLGDTASNSFTWTGAKSGTKYTFTVRCISKDGNAYTSGYDSKGKSITYIAAPKISSLSKNSSGIEVKWGKVNGAEKYRVFYKADGENTWHKAGDTTSTNYTWKGGKKGTKYTFTVRCISKDGKTFTSAYDTKGKSITK